VNGDTGHRAWVGATAVDISAAVRSGQATAVEVVGQHLAHIAAVDGRVGAFEMVDPAGALTAAHALDQRRDRSDLPLAGVPVAVKDNLDVEGLPTRYGSAASSRRPARQDAELVRRLRDARAIVVGKSRMPELALASVSDNAFGAARNPWDLRRIAGGSSGGSAAALASAQVPIAVGSDGGGSIRLPSAACGTVGLKPGGGTVPRRSVHPAAHWHGLSQDGPMATTVMDLAMMLDVLADERRFVAGLDGRGGPLRIAVSNLARTPVGRIRTAEACERAWRGAVERLRARGHDVREATPAYPTYLGKALAARSFGGARYDAAVLGLDVRRVGPRTRTILRLAALTERLSTVDDSHARDWQRSAGEFFSDHDVLVTPATACLAFEHRDWHARGLLRITPPSLRFAAFTTPWNLADLPAAAVPAGLSDDGLPVAVQIVAGRGREDVVLRVAHELERAVPWPRHAPGWLATTDLAAQC
jgi:amidase